jgi:hypothetical protein
MRGISNPFVLLFISSMAVLSGCEPSVFIDTLCAIIMDGSIIASDKKYFFIFYHLEEQIIMQVPTIPYPI